jgi:hypothetical protein
VTGQRHRPGKPAQLRKNGLDFCFESGHDVPHPGRSADCPGGGCPRGCACRASGRQPLPRLIPWQRGCGLLKAGHNCSIASFEPAPHRPAIAAAIRATGSAQRQGSRAPIRATGTANPARLSAALHAGPGAALQWHRPHPEGGPGLGGRGEPGAPRRCLPRTARSLRRDHRRAQHPAGEAEQGPATLRRPVHHRW